MAYLVDNRKTPKKYFDGKEKACLQDTLGSRLASRIVKYTQKILDENMKY